MLTEITEILAIVPLGLLAGSTVYSSMVEIPIRSGTSDIEQLANWHRVFPKASGLLKPFGILTLPLLVIAGIFSMNWIWYIATLFMIILIPFTALLISGANNKLLAINPEDGNDESSELIQKWGQLHHKRTVLCVLAFIAGAIAITT